MTGLLYYHSSRFFSIFLRDKADQVIRNVFVMFPRCMHNYKATFFVVTTYKVRESGVEKEVGFYIRLKQIWKFLELAIFVWHPLNLFATLSGVVTIVNAKGVAFNNDHKFLGVLTENQLESSIHFSLFFTILFWLD